MRLLAVLAVLVPCAAAAAPPADALAVLEFKDKLPKGSDVDIGYLADVVRSAAKEALPGFRIITRENMLVLLRATGRDLADCEAECEVETGRRIGADFVVSGEALRFGSQFKVNMKLHDTRAGELLSGAVASGATADELDRNLGVTVGKLLAPLTSREPRAPATAARPAVEERRPFEAAPRPDAPFPTFGFGAHGGLGYHRSAFDVGAQRTSRSDVAYGAGVVIEGRPYQSFGLGGFLEYTQMAGDNSTRSSFLVGPAFRVRASPSVSLVGGAGYATLSGGGGTGFGGLVGADVSIHGPLVLHAQGSFRTLSGTIVAPVTAVVTSTSSDVLTLEGGLGLLF